tara:strand:- start:301 stop:1068 length:768 start_codon:yes stop_codon:yes gene_type:complete
MLARKHLLTFLSLSLVGSAFADTPSDLPSGYTLQYEQNFDSEDSVEGFMLSDATAWKHSLVGDNGVLVLEKQCDYTPPHRSPHSVALIRDLTFGDFVMEVDVMQTGVLGIPVEKFVKERANAVDTVPYGHRDHCFILGYEDPSHFVYIHVANRADHAAHNVFLVDDAPRVPITDYRSTGCDWGIGEWKKVRIVRNTKKKTVVLYFEDMLTPALIADDIPYDFGFIGFGSFDDIGMVDNIKIWAPAVRESEQTFFQ